MTRSATTLGLCSVGDQTQGFVLATQAPYLLSYIPSHWRFSSSSLSSSSLPPWPFEDWNCLNICTQQNLCSFSYVFCLHVYMCTMYMASCQGSLKRLLDSTPKLELQMVGSWHGVFCKNSKYSFNIWVISLVPEPMLLTNGCHGNSAFPSSKSRRRRALSH